MQNVTFGANPTQHITQRTPSLLWSMVVAASCYGNVSHQSGLGNELKTCCPLQESWNWDGSSPFSMTTTRSTQLKWSSQSHDLNPIKNLWHDLKIAVHQRSPRNFTELEQFCTEGWANIAQSRCAKVGRDLSQQNHSCNCCQRCFHQVLTQECGHLSNHDILVLYF